MSAQIDVHITPGTHASEEAGNPANPCNTEQNQVLLYVYIVFLVLCVCSEQAAGRQRESGSRPGEFVAAGGGQPVSEHQERLSFIVFCAH